MKLSQVQKDVLLGMYAGRALERRYSMGSGYKFYIGQERVAEITVNSLHDKKLIVEGETIKDGPCRNKTEYSLSDLGRLVAGE